MLVQPTFYPRFFARVHSLLLCPNHKIPTITKYYLHSWNQLSNYGCCSCGSKVTGRKDIFTGQFNLALLISCMYSYFPGQGANAIKLTLVACLVSMNRSFAQVSKLALKLREQSLCNTWSRHHMGVCFVFLSSHHVKHTLRSKASLSESP